MQSNFICGLGNVDLERAGEIVQYSVTFVIHLVVSVARVAAHVLVLPCPVPAYRFAVIILRALTGCLLGDLHPGAQSERLQVGLMGSRSGDSAGDGDCIT